MRATYTAFALVVLWQVAVGSIVARYGADYITEIFTPISDALR